MRGGPGFGGVRPLACAVSNISLDHTAILGATVALIAREKAGIFKPGVPVVSAPQSAGVMRVLRDCATDSGAEIELEKVVLTIGAPISVKSLTFQEPA